MRDAISELNTKQTCPICLLFSSGRSLYREHSNTRTAQLLCERCGAFDITVEALTIVGRLDDADRPKVASWISDQNRMGGIPRVTDEILAQLSKAPPMQFSEKAKRLLLYAAGSTSELGQGIRIWEPPIAARVQTFDEEQIRFIANYLVDCGWLVIKQQGPEIFALTGDGLIKAEQWQTAEAKSAQGFVAMWFDSSLLEAWVKGFSVAIESAGYIPMRIDNKEHTNKICDEIIAEIRRSRFVVADFTGQRNGVYYEAGFAAGLAIPVIWTCRKDNMTDLHFDIRQYNCIDWESPEQLCERLRNRILAVIGEGPRSQLH